jgi:hypothetical protein
MALRTIITNRSRKTIAVVAVAALASAALLARRVRGGEPA